MDKINRSRSLMRYLMTGVILLSAAGLSFSGVYIHAKAILAQYLLERSWQQSQPGQALKPWPWADTYPVAKMRVARLQWQAVILQGTSGAALAFGPGHMIASALPGEFGNSVIAGHRDTHFAILKSLQLGDLIEIERVDGELVSYSVIDTKVVHERDMSVVAALDEAALTLITCYPFDATLPGGPLRYVVRAIQRGDAIQESWAANPSMPRRSRLKVIS